MKPIFRIGNDVLGEGAVNFEWRPGGKYIAVCGSNRLVNIYDRSGKLIDAITKAKDVISMCWDKDGDLIALASDQSPVVSFETSVFLLWSHVSSTLAIGTNKGNLVLYNHRASKKTPIVGKHQRMITCGAFSDGDFLALGSKDAFITVSSMNGDSLYSFACNSEPTLIKFHSMKRANEKKKTKVDIMLSAVLEDRMIMLINLDDSENPINLQFQNRYGKIVSYVWFADGYILLGFIKGFVVCISAYASEMGQEIFSVQDFKSYLAYLCINENSEKALIIGDNQLKIRELNQLEEINGLYNIEEESKELYKIGTTEDGQFVAISSTSGTLQVFLAKIPILGAVYNEFMAILSSLNEITIIREGEKVATINIELEPTVIGVGPLNVAIAMNNRAWFYEMNEGSQNLDSAVVYEFEYISTINAMKMNYEFAVAKLDGRAQLHKMKGKDNRYGSDEDTLLFPDSDHSNFRLQDVALTANFLIYCTDGGHLQYFALEDSTCVNEYRHVSGIKTIFPEPGGIRLCFFDETFDAYIYNPVDDGLVKVPIGSTAHFASCLWENFTIDKDTFVIWDSTNLLAFSFLKDQIDGKFFFCIVISIGVNEYRHMSGIKTEPGGQSLLQLGKTAIPHQYKPLMLCKGIMYCQTQSGQIGSILLESHKTQIAVDDKSFAEIENLLQQTLNLKRYFCHWNLKFGIGNS
ncbi:unnamed protein product [Dracunculus medinensis]|uniref:WD repeat-containing protein 19 n=1 Tax=Dracunculus medinensis TaxID=318479 RepID=A0A0N4UN28_DRAME|nr:unnamed protein product [Dracunculus medinensis]